MNKNCENKSDSNKEIIVRILVTKGQPSITDTLKVVNIKEYIIIMIAHEGVAAKSKQ